MINLSQNGFTHEQVLRLLEEPANYYIQVIRNGGVVAKLDYISALMECDSRNAVKYSATVTAPKNDTVDWNKDMLQIVLETNGLLYPFVPMVVIKPEESIDGGSIETLQCFDETVSLLDSSIGRAVYFPKGTLYTSAIEQLLREAGYTFTNIEPSGKSMAFAREAWEIDTPFIAIINELLGEIGYTSLYVNNEGVVTAKAYKRQDIANISYRADARSVILNKKNIVRDNFRKYNYFIGTTFNSELDEPLIYEHEIDSENYPMSTYHTKVKKTVRSFDNCPDYESLVLATRKWADEETLAYNEITMSTLIMPHHEVGEWIAVDSNGASGFYKEIKWNIDLKSKTMTHVLQEVL